MTESPKHPPGSAPRLASAPDASAALAAAPSPQVAAKPGAQKSSGPPPPPIRASTKPAPPTAVSPGSLPLTREPARDTLAPSSFGVLGGAKHGPGTTPAATRTGRAALPTLGELEGVTATATLRPPGAVPPPPRALPMPTPTLDAIGIESGLPLETPLSGGDQPFSALAASLPASPRTRQPHAATVVGENTTMLSANSQGGSAQLPLEAPPGAVPPPGLFIADEPIERRPQQPSLVTAQRELLTRLRVVVLVLGGLLLMAASALVVMAFRRAEPTPTGAPASASAAPHPPVCALVAPPSRISTIERAVPISALVQADGTIALAIADSKTSAAGFIYDPIVGEPKRRLAAPAGSGDVSHVSATEPLLVDRSSPDFAFSRTLAPGLAIGVGPAGLLRRGDDGGAGVVWPLGSGVRVTPPRAISTQSGHFVAFRQGGAEGQIMTGWLRPDGSAEGALSSIEGAPKTLGTPNVSLLGERALVLFSARADKSEPYRVYAALAEAGQHATLLHALDLPAAGGGALTPSLAALPGKRYLVQWTDGNVGQYQVHVRILDDKLRPASDALLVSGKGANAGQGTIVVAGTTTVSFFIQTTAGHDELWGATLSCH